MKNQKPKTNSDVDFSEFFDFYLVGGLFYGQPWLHLLSGLEGTWHIIAHNLDRTFISRNFKETRQIMRRESERFIEKGKEESDKERKKKKRQL